MQNIEITAEETPNPNTYKFLVNKEISPEARNFAEASEAGPSPLASKLFGFPWTESVYLGTDFVSLTKQDWVEWEILKEPLCGLIKEHIEKDEPVLITEQLGEVDDENDSEQVKLIKKIIKTEIRPQVALDGGDIIFHSYKDGVVAIHMQGACAGCPSSSITLKQGIEARLKQALPEIDEVIAI
ncbi:MAG: NifU family protein [Bdellovibrionota bacterium]|nr:NifU family protein [Bdellovibrionota bacterium]